MPSGPLAGRNKDLSTGIPHAGLMYNDRGPFTLTPWVRRLLLAMGAVYLLQLTIFTSPWLIETMGFQPTRALQRPWTLLTYSLLHGGLLHILGNALGLFVFGVPVEGRIGPRSFLRLVLASAAGGAMLSLLMLPLSGAEVTIGASAIVFGIMLAFMLEWPDAPIFLFPIPFPVRVKWLVLGFAAFSLVMGVAGLFGSGDGIAHFAHLGGFAGAWLYLRGGQMLVRPRALQVRERAPAVLVRPPVSDGSGQEHRPQPGPSGWSAGDLAAKAEVDRLLDKISARGIGSLTAEERRFLDEMSRRFKQDH